MNGNGAPAQSSDKQMLNATTNLSLLSDKSEHVVTNLRLVRDKSKPLASQTHCVSLTSLSTGRLGGLQLNVAATMSLFVQLATSSFLRVNTRIVSGLQSCRPKLSHVTLTTQIHVWIQISWLRNFGGKVGTWRPVPLLPLPVYGIFTQCWCNFTPPTGIKVKFTVLSASQR